MRSFLILLFTIWYIYNSLINSKKIDPRMRMEDVKQVLKEEPMPADMLKRQMEKEKNLKDFQDKADKEKADKLRLEKERMEKIRQEAERKLELERKADMERKEKEKALELEKLQRKNAILFPGEKERDRSPLLRNAITPTAGNNKGPSKIEFPNAPYGQGILIRNNNNNNRPFDLQPKTPNNNYPKPDLNKDFNPFLKNDANKIVVKPIFYANPNKETPTPISKPENRDISPLKGQADVKKSPISKGGDIVVINPNDESKPESNDKPSVSPRNITPILSREPSDKVKDNKSKDAEEKNKRNALADLIAENRNKREQFQHDLDKKKQENEAKLAYEPKFANEPKFGNEPKPVIEKADSEKRKLEYEVKNAEKRNQREKERNDMIADIVKRRSLNKRSNDDIEVEVYMPQQNLSSDEEDEIDEREEIVPLEKKSSAPEEEKGDLESARGKGASPRKDNDMTMDEENLVDMINEMKQIVDESTIEENDENQSEESGPTVTTGVEERDDMSEDTSEPSTPLRDISNQIEHKFSQDYSNFSLQNLIEESLGADKAKVAIQECSKKLSAVLENLDLPIEDHYSKIKEDLLQTFDNENIAPNFPYIMYKALSEL